MNYGTTELILVIALVMLIIAFVVPLALVVFAVYWLVNSSRSKEGLKKCKYCAEFIKEEALVCRLFGREQN